MSQRLTMNMVARGNLKHRKKHYIGLVCGILLICLSGTGLGLVGFLIYEWVCIRLEYGYGHGFNCVPAVMLMGCVFICCCVNLWIQVKKVSKYSIVENIRELG